MYHGVMQFDLKDGLIVSDLLNVGFSINDGTEESGPEAVYLEVRTWDAFEKVEGKLQIMMNPSVLAQLVDIGPKVLTNLGFTPVDGEWYHPSLRDGDND